MKEYEKQCSNCKWCALKPHESGLVCVNYKSEWCAVFINGCDSCEQWEEMRENETS